MIQLQWLNIVWTVLELTRIRVFLGGTITVMVGGCQVFWSRSRAMRSSAITTSLQPDTAGQKDASIEPGKQVEGVKAENGRTVNIL